MNKQDFAYIGVLVTVSIFVTNLGTDMITGVQGDLKEHEKLDCHPIACNVIEKLANSIEENHCINVNQLQGKTPNQILDECL